MKQFWRIGGPQVIVTASALSVVIVLIVTLIGVVICNGLGFFWPDAVAKAELKDGSYIAGEIAAKEKGVQPKIQFKTGNRDIYGQDFRWVDRAEIVSIKYPSDMLVLERKEHGNFYGTLKSLSAENQEQKRNPPSWSSFQGLRKSIEKRVELAKELENKITGISRRSEKIRLAISDLSYGSNGSKNEKIEALTLQRDQLQKEFDSLSVKHGEATGEIRKIVATFEDVTGTKKEIPVIDIVRAYQPNTMSILDKSIYYISRLEELFFMEPRESNTEGGLYPAIFGTVLMVLLMNLFSMPLGVIAAVYLREYAREGFLVRLVRIAVNNLAGVPSIVYGVFGLGFFVYGVGSNIDSIFFPERLPTPTFGTGGILWSSLTLALLTVPVVIVATEESLAAVPKGIREGALSLGATKLQTLTRILLPMATPGIMTGIILSMARAAGEVAPLMLVGVVKLAPALPIDSDFPFFHIDRKFMHLGFHIFDVGFQSPNVEAAKPMVFVTTMLLLCIVIAASSVAIWLRNYMQKRYTSRTF